MYPMIVYNSLAYGNFLGCALEQIEGLQQEGKKGVSEADYTTVVKYLFEKHDAYDEHDVYDQVLLAFTVTLSTVAFLDIFAD